jgi:hypothetical protein
MRLVLRMCNYTKAKVVKNKEIEGKRYSVPRIQGSENTELDTEQSSSRLPEHRPLQQFSFFHSVSEHTPLDDTHQNTIHQNTSTPRPACLLV